jgi:predicted  nucleic acid-binding Zn-ribbon protein
MLRIADLWRLQEIDSALDAARGSLEAARDEMRPSDEVAATQASLDAELQRLRNAEATYRDLELQTDDLKAKIAPAEQKLYSGNIKNPKELQDLQQDIEQLKRQLSAVEDRDLEALAELEAAQKSVEGLRAQLAAVEQAWTETQADLKSRETDLAAEIARLDADRAAQAERIDGETMRTYEHVRRAHQGRGVAKLDRNLCLGCRITLPTNIVNRARAGQVLVQCPNCERVLFAS